MLAYVNRLRRKDARPLDLTTREDTIEGEVVTITVSRYDLINTAREEIFECIDSSTEPLDMRLPLHVVFYQECKIPAVLRNESYIMLATSTKIRSFLPKFLKTLISH